MPAEAPPGAPAFNLPTTPPGGTFDPAHVNRVVLCTDGDFNVGVSDQGSLIRLIEEEARSGVFLTILGFGMGNLKDSTLQKLADKGNGNYGYVDTFDEARKLLVEQLSGTLVTIAKDVKIQVEFNPAHVAAYRLIGYEKRLLRAEDFHDDKKDAGEIGAGHTVTAFYELVPPGKEGSLPKVDALKYQAPGRWSAASASNEILTLKLRYKLPQADTSELLTFPVAGPEKPLAEASPDFRFAAAVACWGMLLRDSEHKGQATFRNGVGAGPGGQRRRPLRLSGRIHPAGRNLPGGAISSQKTTTTTQVPALRIALRGLATPVLADRPSGRGGMRWHEHRFWAGKCMPQRSVI